MTSKGGVREVTSQGVYLSSWEFEFLLDFWQEVYEKWGWHGSRVRSVSTRVFASWTGPEHWTRPVRARMLACYACVCVAWNYCRECEDWHPLLSMYMCACIFCTYNVRSRFESVFQERCIALRRCVKASKNTRSLAHSLSHSTNRRKPSSTSSPFSSSSLIQQLFSPSLPSICNERTSFLTSPHRFTVPLFWQARGPFFSYFIYLLYTSRLYIMLYNTQMSSLPSCALSH